MMELKQLAESITMVAFKKKIGSGISHLFKNRPKLWSDRLTEEKKTKNIIKRGREPVESAQFETEKKWKVASDYLY